MEISFVIVNWNTKDLLRGCLDSIAKTVGSLSHEIIVVDNASSDGSADMLAREYPSVRVIANSKNSGFGAANNQGFAVMKGKYALLINTDAVEFGGSGVGNYGSVEVIEEPWGGRPASVELTLPPLAGLWLKPRK